MRVKNTLVYSMRFLLEIGTISKGDWSNGMIGVSKTFGGSSILSSPAREKPRSLEFIGLCGFCIHDNRKFAEHTFYYFDRYDLGG